jgi:hypothetical protein
MIQFLLDLLQCLQPPEVRENSELKVRQTVGNFRQLPKAALQMCAKEPQWFSHSKVPIKTAELLPSKDFSFHPSGFVFSIKVRL